VGTETERDEATRRQAAINEALANSDACWRMEQEVIVRQRDEARHRARRACQVLIAEVGAEGPADVDSVAERAAAEIRDLRDKVADLLAAQEESEHSMHLRVRAGYRARPEHLRGGAEGRSQVGEGAVKHKTETYGSVLQTPEGWFLRRTGGDWGPSFVEGTFNEASVFTKEYSIRDAERAWGGALRRVPAKTVTIKELVP
jgi:hypothetical protein